MSRFFRHFFCVAALIVLAPACGDSDPSDDDYAAAVTTSSSTTTTTSTTTSTTVWVTTTTAPPTTTTTLEVPRGSLRTVGYRGYGQTTRPGNCSYWQLVFTNYSNTEITEITFAPPGGSYSTLDGYNPETQKYPPEVKAAAPSPVRLAVSLAPDDQQVHRFSTCTRTPVPPTYKYEFDAEHPDEIEFTWVTGDTGRGGPVEYCDKSRCDG